MFQVPKLGVMLVGWGGNNGSTVTAAVLANRLGLTWKTKEGLQSANYYGSITQAATVCLGMGPEGEVHVPLKSMLPMVQANDIVFDGKFLLTQSLTILYISRTSTYISRTKVMQVRTLLSFILTDIISISY